MFTFFPGNDSTVFLPGVVIGTHTDGTFDVLVDRSSFVGDGFDGLVSRLVSGSISRATENKRRYFDHDFLTIHIFDHSYF